MKTINQMPRHGIIYLTNEEDTYQRFFNKKEHSENKIKKREELVALINEYGQKVFKKDNFVDIISNINVGYLDSYGYYIINEGEAFTKELFLCGESVDEAFKRAIHEAMMEFAIIYEIAHREELISEFKESYQLKYINYNVTLSYVKYLMEAWRVYYEANIPEDVIKFYEDYLQYFVIDGITYEWKYNQTTCTFDCVEKTQKLVRK